MVVKIEKEVLIEISDLFVEVNMLSKETLLNSLILNKKSIDFTEKPSAELTLYTEANEKLVLELAFRLEKMADLVEKYAG